MKRNIYVFSIILLAFSLLVISCGKEDNPTNPIPDKNNETGTFTDSRDNHTYKWVKIGEQTWMAENLSYKPSSGNYAAYNNENNNVATYGYLYDWEIAQNVAPIGWHLPSEAEWMQLVDFLGGPEVAGGKMKEKGTVHWDSPNTGADNSSGFTARANGGYDLAYDNFFALKYSANWWSSTDGYGDNNDAAFFMTLYKTLASSSRGAHSKKVYYGVRCIKD